MHGLVAEPLVFDCNRACATQGRNSNNGIFAA
jgi:hypothetical protein